MMVTSLPVDAEQIAAVVRRDASIDGVAVVHCDTTTGLLNDIEALGRAVRAASGSVTFIFDAMSSFAAVPIDLAACHIDGMVASSNKCIQGVPGDMNEGATRQ